MRISDWSSDVCSSDLGGGEQGIGHGFDADIAGIMRRGNNLRVAPEDMAPWQRFGGEDVERGAGKLAGLQRREQIGLDQMLATADMHEIAAQIGRAHVCTAVTNAPLVCRLLLEKRKQ